MSEDPNEVALANSIGSLLRTIMGGGTMGDATSTQVGPTAPGTAVGPIQGVDAFTNIQSGQTQAQPDLSKLAGWKTPTTGETPIGSEESSPTPGNTTINSGYGPRGGGNHEGIDIGVPSGTTVVAAIGGKITHASNDGGGYGNLVIIEGANGMSVRYGHLSYIGAKVGSTIRAGQPIGKSGGDAGSPGAGNSTGAHLHFEARQNGQAVDPIHFLSIKGNGIVAGTSGEAPATEMAPSRTISPQDAADTSMARLTGLISGKGDPGSENSVEMIAKEGQQGQQKVAGGSGDGDPGGIESFLAATRQHESGGNYKIYNQSGQSNASGAYQFIGTTWRGMGGSTANAAEASPQEQDAIARKMATQLFNQFHSWRLVAIAWYGGPAVAQKVANGQNPGSPTGQGPYLAYGDTIKKMMGN